MTITVQVNGQRRALAGPVGLDVLVAELTDAAKGVAAALNDAVVPRSHWATTPVGNGDRVEILTAVQGG